MTSGHAARILQMQPAQVSRNRDAATHVASLRKCPRSRATESWTLNFTIRLTSDRVVDHALARSRCSRQLNSRNVSRRVGMTAHTHHGTGQAVTERRQQNSKGAGQSTRRRVAAQHVCHANARWPLNAGSAKWRETILPFSPARRYAIIRMATILIGR